MCAGATGVMLHLRVSLFGGIGHSSDQVEGMRGYPSWGGGGQELERSGDPAVSL